MAIYEKVCVICGKSFTAKAATAKYCSRHCSNAAAWKKLKEKEGRTDTKICLKCGKEFTPNPNGWTRRYWFECVPEETYSQGGAGMRRLVKKWALEYKGGKCQCCGYDECAEALDFHHLDESQKDFSISDRNIPTDWEQIKKELEKCILVCSNCHREIHAGYRKVSGKSNNE